MSPETAAVDPETLTTIQQAFLEALPRIQRVARFRLRHLCGEAKEEALQEVIALSWQAYRSLSLQGRNVTPLVGKIAEYSARRVRCGRLFVSTKLRDALSPIPRREAIMDGTPDLLDELSDRRAPSPADEAILRIDVEEWLNTLDGIQRQVAEELAGGMNTTDVARKHHVTRTRIWQRREDLKETWDRLHDENLSPATINAR